DEDGSAKKGAAVPLTPGTSSAPNDPAAPTAAPTTPAPAAAATFGTQNSTVVTAQTGSSATLPCVVRKFGNGVVSWVRRKDFHLLTVGLTTYSSDDRFLVVHTRHLQGPPRRKPKSAAAGGPGGHRPSQQAPQHSPPSSAFQNWGLQIRFVQPRDAGLYECQVSSHPPASIFVELKVVEARAEIVGAPDLHLKSGSTLRLSCVLRQSTEPPVYVFWYHDDRMINYDRERGVSVEAERFGSALVVREARRVDSGNYTCVPSNARPASVNVHVLNGEKPAAMQHGSRSGCGPGRGRGGPTLLAAMAALPAATAAY
ncbi:interference hedgehog-like, partial [Hetaerina americana]|uniref:interference hedgehog-like n=1 Tax=Hetaerina americana TaxID=62018 RepID=UPI003A7F496C